MINLINEIIILNIAYNSSRMNGQASNRILPIKSLLENLKQESKRQYLQLDNKGGHGHLHQINTTNPPQTHREHHLIDHTSQPAAKDIKKGISLNKNNERNNHLPFSSKDLPQPQEPGFNFYTPKKDRNHGDKSSRFVNHPEQAFRMDMQPEHYGYSNKNNKSEQIIYHQAKHDIKSSTKNCDTTVKFTEEFDKESSILTEKMNSKFEEETRSFSKFEKMESQPIFKDEVTKIKTELFHKEALLFTKTQQLEEKMKIIHELQAKLDSKDRKNPSQMLEKIKNMEATIKNQSNQIDFLRKELQQTKQLYNKHEEETSTNYTLINLKLRQYEAQERQKSFQITEMKEKEKKKFQQQDKLLKTLKQALKERDDIIKQTKEQLTISQQKFQATQTLLKEKEKEFSKQLQIKETFIRQLSAQIGDLKGNLKSMEQRIREMIQEESEMKQMGLKFNQAKKLYQQKEKLNESNVSQLKNKINELNEIVFKRESSLIAYKEKNIELQEKLKKASQSNRANSPPKNASTSTSKLIKDNQRLSAIAKDFDKRLYQSMKLNEALNEEIVKRELTLLNASYLSRFGKSIQ